jgi:hypothetical protein
VYEAYRQASKSPFACAARVDRGAFNFLQNQVGPLKKNLACGQQFHLALRPAQQERADFLFQLLDLTRQRRLGDAQAGRRSPEM